MYRVVIFSGTQKGIAKRVESVTSDFDGDTLAYEGNVVIYSDDLDQVRELGIEVELV